MKPAALIFLSLALVACDSSLGSITLELGNRPAGRPLAVTLVMSCTFTDSVTSEEVVPRACQDVAPTATAASFESAYDGAPTGMTCSGNITLTDSCAQEQITLGVANFNHQFFEGEEVTSPANLDLPPTELNTRFDDDNDGFSNYLEHASGTNPRSNASVPSTACDICR